MEVEEQVHDVLSIISSCHGRAAQVSLCAKCVPTFRFMVFAGPHHMRKVGRFRQITSLFERATILVEANPFPVECAADSVECDPQSWSDETMIGSTEAVDIWPTTL